MDLLRSGIHVLVEKPMALRVQDCDAMISAAEEAHVVLSVGHMRRFYGSCRFVADALAAGQLGASSVSICGTAACSVGRWPRTTFCDVMLLGVVSSWISGSTISIY